MGKGLYIPFDRFTETGGPATFMKNLKLFLDDSGFKYLNSIDNADSIFFPIMFDIDALEKIKRANGTIIQRLDGIYYPQKHGENHVELNKEIKNIYNNFADFVVFQSEYSKKQCFEMLGKKNEEEYSLIVNGVNTGIFYPAESFPDPEEKIKFVTSGRFRNIDMIEPVIKALDSLEGEFPFELNVIGPVTDDSLDSLFDRDYINMLGDRDMMEVAGILRENHIFIYSHLNPPCPNSVLEAIATGLPLTGFNSGAMEELLPFSKDLLAYVSDEVFQSYSDFDYKKLAEKLKICVQDYDKYRDAAIANCKNYSFENCGNKYIEAFGRAEKNECYITKLLNLFKK